MSAAYIELVRLGDGEFALQRQDDPEHPLVTIRFSGEAQQILEGADMEIARIMIQAGAQGVNMIQQQKLAALTDESTPRVLH